MKAAYLILPLLLTATALSCGGGQDPCQVVGCRADAGTVTEDASAAEGGPDGGTVDPLPEGCTTPNEPLKNPEKCLVDALGVYVSPTGDDANPGTKAKPVKTIGAALKLDNNQKRILVCEGEYGGSVEITKEISIVGGLACDFTSKRSVDRVFAGRAWRGQDVRREGGKAIRPATRRGRAERRGFAAFASRTWGSGRGCCGPDVRRRGEARRGGTPTG